MKVFVYGTLKSGYHNNRLLEGATFVGEGLTLTKYSMIDAGFPVIVERGDDRRKVLGEVWDVGDRRDILDRLDTLEGEGTMYDRKTVEVWLTEKRKRVEAEIYVGCEDFWDDREDSNEEFDCDGHLRWDGPVRKILVDW